MKAPFLEFWNRIDAKGSPESVFAQLQTLYSEPNRFYHNLTHIKNCINEFSYVRELAESPNIVEFALWYHDAIYDTKSKGSEEKSAQLAYIVSIIAHLSPSFAQDVHDLILVSKHNVLPNTIDEKVFTDIDLSILGRLQPEFDEYETNIRKEYAWVPEEQFKEGRKAILQMFLDRNAIYSTDFFREKYETQARDNLQRSIKELKY